MVRPPFEKGLDVRALPHRFFVCVFRESCLFCFVLFCFVLFCFVLFCFVLFCFVLFCLFVYLFVFFANHVFLCVF